MDKLALDPVAFPAVTGAATAGCRFAFKVIARRLALG
jgi:hypothetical protein